MYKCCHGHSDCLALTQDPNDAGTNPAAGSYTRSASRNGNSVQTGIHMRRPPNASRKWNPLGLGCNYVWTLYIYVFATYTYNLNNIYNDIIYDVSKAPRSIY